MPPRIPPEVLSALNPFLNALTGMVKDTARRAAEAAVDAALEEVETRVEDIGRRVSTARRNIKEKPAPVGVGAVVVEGTPRAKRRRRRKS